MIVSDSDQTIWRVVNSEFERSVTTLEDLIDDDLPEVAFVGRSNAGKSSLLNAVCSRKSLARVSKTPGRTQAINLFSILLKATNSGLLNDSVSDAKNEKEELILRFADLPGYGYAKVASEMKENWRVMLGEYLQTRQALTSIVLVQDARRKPKDEEKWFFHSCELPVIVGLTKIDKIKKSQVSAVVKGICEELGASRQDVVPVSLLKPNHPGVQQIVDLIVSYSSV